MIGYLPTSVELPNAENPLGFRIPGYDRIYAYACLSKDCMIGLRTAGCCSHVCCAFIFLGVYARHPDWFQSSYRGVHRLDIRNVDALNRALFGNEDQNDEE